MATTDFDVWVDGVDPEDHHEVYRIYQSISQLANSDVSDNWGLRGSKKETSEGSVYFLKSEVSGDTLMLASDKAKDTFIYYLTKRFVGSELDIEEWYDFKCKNEKDD